MGSINSIRNRVCVCVVRHMCVYRVRLFRDVFFRVVMATAERQPDVEARAPETRCG